jgi:xylan 1,4-beta-xylosidase
MHVTNPIIPGFYPDPSIARVGEDYYLVNSSFEYFPGVPIFHSRDLVNWQQIGHCLTRRSQLELNLEPSNGNVFSSTSGFTPGIYAPTLRYHAGKFYMVTTNVTIGKHFYVSADDPAGEWSEPMWVNDVGNIGNSIDPSLFFDNDGRVYFACNGTVPEGIYQFEIDLQSGKRISETRRISDGFCGKNPEGPHLYRINNLYYLLTAEGGTEYGHLVAIGRSDSPWGPFEPCPHNPILTHRSYASPIQATGHGDLFQAVDGSWWIVVLGVRPNGYPPAYHLGRETFLAPVTWTDQNWPVIGDNGKVPLVFDVPGLTFQQKIVDVNCRDDFIAQTLGAEWNFLRNPAPDDFSLDERQGWLRLRCSQTSFCAFQKSPAFIGRRQRHFDCRVETLVDLVPNQQGDEAGLVVLMNGSHHYEIAVKSLDHKPHLIVRRQIGSLTAIVARHPLKSWSAKLSITADRDLYKFFYAEADEAPLEIARGETRYLSTEVAGGFTGVYFGLYAKGESYESGVAFFDYFTYQAENLG